MELLYQIATLLLSLSPSYISSYGAKVGAKGDKDEKSCIPACKKIFFDDDAISTYFNATHFSKDGYVDVSFLLSFHLLVNKLIFFLAN